MKNIRFFFFFLSENFHFFGGKIFSVFEQACFRYNSSLCPTTLYVDHGGPDQSTWKRLHRLVQILSVDMCPENTLSCLNPRTMKKKSYFTYANIKDQLCLSISRI